MKTLQTMEVLSALYGRHAVRRYAGEAMSRESIEELVNAAIQAPSAMNLQPWAFAIVQGADRLKAYSDRAKAYLLSVPDGVTPHARDLLGEHLNLFYGAPALIVICATSQEQQAAEDCCLAAQNLMLAAFAAGLATCPIGFARPWLILPDTKHEIGIPAELIPVFPLVVGHPDEGPGSPGRRPAKIIWI
jgi:nitroreductase